MVKVLKYVFYVALIFVAFLIGKGILDGSINRATTVGQVMSDVQSDAGDVASNVADRTQEVAGAVWNSATGNTPEVQEIVIDETAASNYSE